MVQAAKSHQKTEFKSELKDEFDGLLKNDIAQIRTRTREQNAFVMGQMQMNARTGASRAGIAATQFNAHFVAADANKDKLLNFEEYLVFMEKEKASRKIRREPEIERTKEQLQAMFDALNKITPGADGVSKADLSQFTRYSSDYVVRNLRPGPV